MLRIGFALLIVGILFVGLVSSDVMLSGVPAASSQILPVATPTCPPSWSVVPSANVPAYSNGLSAVDARSANDIWAVGRIDDSNGTRALILHWDGIAWRVVPNPSPGSRESF